MQIICPLCQLPLIKEQINNKQGRWYCDNNHSFDIAKQGYTNLLPVQNKKSRSPGDDAEMVASRQRFLAKELYGPVATSLNGLVSDYVKAQALNQVTVIDAGCGEGYYLRQLAEQAGDTRTLAILGLDISKWAVQAAARQDKQPGWVVGSNANLPVLSSTVDRVLCMFGFPVYPEFARVLKPGGKLIQVDAGPDHLRELREIVYPEVKSAPDKTLQVPEGFHHLNTDTLRFTIDLAGAEAIADLLAMTPHLYRASQEGRAKAAELDRISLTIDIRLHTLERMGSDPRAVF